MNAKEIRHGRACVKVVRLCDGGDGDGDDNDDDIDAGRMNYNGISYKNKLCVVITIDLMLDDGDDTKFLGHELK